MLSSLSKWLLWSVGGVLFLIHAWPFILVALLRTPEWVHALKSSKLLMAIVSVAVALISDVALRHFFHYSFFPTPSIENGFIRFAIFELLLALLLLLFSRRLVDPCYPRSRLSSSFPMKRKVCVVTGGNSGIGYECALSLACLGAHVIIGCRSEERGKAAANRINAFLKKKTKSPGVCVFEPLQMSSFESVVSFAGVVKEAHLKHAQDEKVHGLVNNAGYFPGNGTQLTSDGFEESFQVMHLSHFLLTMLLLPHMSDQGRIVNVSSEGHKGAVRKALEKGSFDQFDGMSGFELYGRAKMANVLFTRELQRRLKARSSGIRTLTLHPGCVHTNIWNSATFYPSVVLSLLPYLPRLFPLASSLLMRDSEQGSADMTYAVCDEASGALEDGAFLLCGSPATTNDLARNEALQRQFWEDSSDVVSTFCRKQSVEVQMI